MLDCVADMLTDPIAPSRLPKPRCTKAGLLLFGCLLAPGGPALAEDNPEQDVFPLPRVAVQGKRIEAPASILTRSVTASDLEARNARTVGEGLSLVPGVNVQIGGSSGDARAWVRGYRDYDVLVLFDGIPIASGFEGTVDLNELATQRIERINVMKSAPSVIYGTNGVGGVIDIVPQMDYLGWTADALAELGTDQQQLLRAGLGGSKSRHSYSVAAQYQSADDYSLSSHYTPQLNQPAGTRRNSDFERQSLLAQYALDNWALGEASVFVNLSDAEKGLAIEAGVEDPDFERLTLSRRQTIGLTNHFSQLPVSLKLFYNGYDSEVSVYTDDTFSVLDEVQSNEDHALGGKLYSTLQTSANNSLVLSISGQNNVFRGEGELEQGNKAELDTYTLAAENQYWINHKLSLAVGGIYSRVEQTLLGNSSSEFNPQLALAWQAAEGFSVHASAAERTRFPNLREFYRRRYGNPDLQPQTAVNYELGAIWQHNNSWSTDFALYRSDIDGLIERPDRRSAYVNLPSLTIQGVETASGGWINPQLYLKLAYTLVDAAEPVPGGGERQLRSRPKHTWLGEARYRFGRQLTLAINGLYVMGTYDLDQDDVYTRLPAYLVVNLRAAWAFTPRYQAYLAVTNLGDQDTIQRIGDPRPGRAVVVGFEYRGD